MMGGGSVLVEVRLLLLPPVKEPLETLLDYCLILPFWTKEEHRHAGFVKAANNFPPSCRAPPNANDFLHTAVTIA